MAIGDILTLRKTETGIPWHIGLGAMQHLTPQTARIMLAQPWYTWTASGIPTLEVTRVPVAGGVTRAIWSGGIADVSGTGAECDGTIIATTRNITREGALTSNCKTQTIAASVVGTLRPNGMFMQDGANFVMRFYTSENGDIWVSPMYGAGDVANKNALTCLTVDYTRVDNNVRYTASSTINNQVQPVNDKKLYINGVASLDFACADISRRYYKICSFKFNTSCNLYVTASGINKHLSGDESENIENLQPQPEVPAEDRKTELFYKSTIYKRVDGVQKDVKVGESNITFVVQYKSNDGTENYPAIGQVAGYVNDFSPVNTSTWGNVKWKKSNNAKIVQIKVDYTGEDGVKHSQTFQPLNFPYNTKNYGFYESYQNGTIRYYSKYATNMRIYANESDIDSYLGGDPTVKPIYDGNTGRISPTDYIGDPVVYNSTDYTVDADMSSCWILTKEEVDELAEVFATGLTKEEGDDNTLINITKTCARSFMAQSEPIDAVVDLFWLPIDVTGFCTSENDNMTFSYDRYGILNGAKTIIDGTGEAMTVAESNTLRIGDGIGKLFNPINNLSTNIGATIGSAGSTSEVINTYSGTTPTPSIE